MAKSREYAYQIKANKISLFEKDVTTGDDGLNYTYTPGGGLNLPSSATAYKSPLATVADGLEIEYVYSPEYHIDETDKVDTQIDTYVSTDGLLKIIDQGDNDYTASPESLGDGSYIVLRKAGRFNGLHKVKAAGTGYITLYTKFSGTSTVQQSFEETIDLYYNVDVLNNEEDTVDLPSYLSKALVYYLKARINEDARDIEGKEYFMREFRVMLEKYQNAKVAGPRRVMPGVGAIR